MRRLIQVYHFNWMFDFEKWPRLTIMINEGSNSQPTPINKVYRRGKTYTIYSKESFWQRGKIRRWVRQNLHPVLALLHKKSHRKPPMLCARRVWQCMNHTPVNNTPPPPTPPSLPIDSSDFSNSSFSNLLSNTLSSICHWICLEKLLLMTASQPNKDDEGQG